MNQNDYETGFNRDERFIFNKFRGKELGIIMENNQPERSKREDSNRVTTVTIESSSKLPKVKFSEDMLKRKDSGCGALNTQETE